MNEWKYYTPERWTRLYHVMNDLPIDHYVDHPFGAGEAMFASPTPLRRTWTRFIRPSE